MKRIRSAAAVIAVFAVISGGVIWKAPQAEAFRLKLYDTVFSPSHEDVGVEFVDTVYNNMPVIEDETLKAKANEIIERDGFILYPSVLPDGYEVSGIESGKKNRIVAKDENENEIDIIYYTDLNVSYYNDTDKSENIEILINGQNAVLRESTSDIKIDWSIDKCKIQLVTFNNSFSTSTLVDIAEKIKKYKKIL